MTILYLMLCVLLIVLLIWVGICFYLIRYGLTSKPLPGGRSIAGRNYHRATKTKFSAIEENKFAEQKKVQEWKSAHPFSSASIHSVEGLQLVASFCDAKAEEPSNHLWVLIIHGYKEDSTSMESVGMHYWQMGFSVVLPDNRAHGRSEGEIIGMGGLDLPDLLGWITWICEKDPKAIILLHGESMGASAALVLSGENPDHVKAVVSDCGFTSAWDIFGFKLKRYFHLPPEPILRLSNWILRKRYGYDMRTASGMDAIRRARMPILFIHGDADKFVPTQMVYSLHDSYKGPKEIFLVPGAGHQQAKYMDVTAYWETIRGFLKKYGF